MSAAEQTGTERSSRTVVIEPRGELDIANADQFRTVLAEAVAASPELVLVDLDAVTFLDSTGLGALAHAAGKLRKDGGRLAVRNASSLVRKVIASTGLDETIELLGDDEPAGS